MELAALIGINISDFWEMTPLELNIYAKSYTEKKQLEQKQNVYQAYLISRWVWQRKIDIEKIINSIGKEKKTMTDEQMLKQVQVLNMMFGGEVKAIGEE